MHFLSTAVDQHTIHDILTVTAKIYRHSKKHL